MKMVKKLEAFGPKTLEQLADFVQQAESEGFEPSSPIKVTASSMLTFASIVVFVEHGQDEEQK